MLIDLGSTTTLKTIGQRIRELREEKDLSLRELAGKIEVSAAFLSDVELGRRYPSDKHLLVLVGALDTSLEDLQQYDTRPPLQQFRRMTLSDPEYGFALRQMMDKKVSSKELLDFIKQRDEQRKEDKRDEK